MYDVPGAVMEHIREARELYSGEHDVALAFQDSGSSETLAEALYVLHLVMYPHGVEGDTILLINDIEDWVYEHTRADVLAVFDEAMRRG